MTNKEPFIQRNLKSSSWIKNRARSVNRWLAAMGMNPIKAVNSLRGVSKYFCDLRRFRAELSSQAMWKIESLYPILDEYAASSGTAKGHYFHQDLLVSRCVYERNPRRHIDIGSRVDGFVAHVASFRRIEIGDIRPLQVTVPNITFFQLDLMADISQEMRSVCDSLSCLHTLEHFGLGRYGDRVDAFGYMRGLANLVLMLQPNGLLYLSVPIGRQRIEFNAHRIFGMTHLLELFSEHQLAIISFSYVDDNGDLFPDVGITPTLLWNLNGMRYGLGIFELRAPPAEQCY